MPFKRFRESLARVFLSATKIAEGHASELWELICGQQAACCLVRTLRNMVINFRHTARPVRSGLGSARLSAKTVAHASDDFADPTHW